MLNNIDVCIGFFVLLPLGLILGLVGGLIARDRANAVRFRDYSAAAGTVAMRVRPSPGADRFRAALGVADEPEPVEAA